jgi:uncharacterized protein YndB with AHSA1/START domain
VFKAWTNEQLLAAWWGPAGFSTQRCRLDPTRGGALFIEMKSEEGSVVTVQGNFQLIDEPEQLVFTISGFTDESGSARLKILHTIIFLPELYTTRITLQAVVMRSAPECDVCVKGLAQCWQESLDKLELLMRQLRFRCIQRQPG